MKDPEVNATYQSQDKTSTIKIARVRETGFSFRYITDEANSMLIHTEDLPDTDFLENYTKIDQ